MKKYILYVSALFVLAACNKDNVKSEGLDNTITLTATVNVPATKVAPDSLTNADNAVMTFHWEAGDQVLLASDASASAATQLFTLKEGSISADGKTAQFTGTPLADMSGYTVFYAGCNTSEATFKKQFDTQDNSIVLNNAANNCNIIMSGTGMAEGFYLDTFTKTLRLKLTGNDIVLGSLKYYLKGAANPSTTISFGADGLALSSAATEVWVPVNAVNDNGFTLRFYDKSGNPVMEKTTARNISSYTGTLLFPVLTPVAKTAGVQYFSLAEAVAAAEADATVELLTDFAITSTITIDKSVTLNLGTHTLTNACSGYAFNLNTTEAGKIFKITGKSKTECGHIVSNGTEGHKGLMAINGSAITFELDYVKVHGATENDAYVGITNTNSEALFNDYTSSSDVIILTDCTIKTTSVILGGNQAHSAAASLNISGGSYTGAKGFRYAGTVKSVIDGATITVDQGIALYPYSDTDLKNSFVYDNATGNLNHDAISVGGDGSDLVITNTTVESVSKTAVATEYLGKATIESGTFSSTCTSNYGAPLRCNTSGGTIVINGGTIDGSKALYAVFSNTKTSQYPNAVSTITINGGTIKGGSSDMGFVSGGKAYVEINGGTFTTAVKLFEGNQQWVRINAGCTAIFNEKVTGMTGTASVAIPAGTFKKAISDGDFTAGSSISGGLFYEAAPYSSYIVSGYMAVQNEGTPATWSIVKQPGVGLGSMDKGDQEEW